MVWGLFFVVLVCIKTWLVCVWFELVVVGLFRLFCLLLVLFVNSVVISFVLDFAGAFVYFVDF